MNFTHLEVSWDLDTLSYKAYTFDSFKKRAHFSMEQV